jgi:hypothetical protein
MQRLSMTRRNSRKVLGFGLCPSAACSAGCSVRIPSCRGLVNLLAGSDRRPGSRRHWPDRPLLPERRNMKVKMAVRGLASAACGLALAGCRLTAATGRARSHHTSPPTWLLGT